MIGQREFIGGFWAVARECEEWGERVLVRGGLGNGRELGQGGFIAWVGM